MGNSDPLAALDREFVVEVATSPELVREAQRLRYQVYCVERGYVEGSADDSIEVDHYDQRSHHVLLRHRQTGEVVGTVRLVIPASKASADCLPMSLICEPGVLEGVPIHSTAEISRFALSKQRRSIDSRSNALLRLALMRGVMRLSNELGLTHWCAIMEKGLLRLLERFGIHFVATGPMVEYHGMRQPCVARIDGVLARAKRECPAFYEFAANDAFCRTWDQRLAA